MLQTTLENKQTTIFFELLTKQFQAMKTKNLLKLALMMVAMFAFFGTQAQVVNIDHDDDVATGTNYVEALATTYQTVNLGFRLYVRPDATYNPAYDGTGNAGTGLNANSRWTWVYGADFASGTGVKAAANENWVDLVPATLPGENASRTYWVQESNTAFACTDLGTSHTVFVTGAPTADIAGQGNGWTEDVVGIEFSRCATGADIGDIIDVTLSELGAPAAAQSYTFGISVAQQALDASLTPVGAINDVTGAYGVAATPGTLAAGLAQTHTIPALPLLAATTPTQYRFTITAASITSMISLRSHLRAGVANAGYNGAATTITYNILPVPTTGPIFHIPNAF